MRRLKTLATAGLCLAAAFTSARAEVSEIKAAQQYGLSYLPLMIMEDQKLVEKRAKEAGLDLKTTWVKLGGPGAMNEGLISGSIDFAAGGIPSLATIWARTKGTPIEVRGAASIADMPMELVTNNPNIKTVRDFTDQDKIAVTSIRVSSQALLLQMAAAKEFGEENFAKLDPLTVSLPHPDAMSLLISGKAGISAHFSSPPFQNEAKTRPGIRAILNSYEILGGPSALAVVFTTTKFYEANPKAYAAFVGALEDADRIINADKKAAAETYKRMTGAKESAENLAAMLSEPGVEMTTTPHLSFKIASFMHKVGGIKVAPTSWKDMFFPNLHHLPGS